MVVTAIELHGVTRVFDGLPAVTQVRLAVPAGETLWLCGGNGSGKSTLLRLIATALSPTFGGGSVLGFDLLRDREEIRARLEWLGHQPRLYGDLTARENLEFVARLCGLSRARVMPALERVGLDEVAGVRVAGFSQGMRQRLAIARCLMRDPEVVLLDEPYAGLDASARVLVDELLSDAAHHRRTVMIASHEAPPADAVDRRVFLDSGRVVAAEAVPR
jgi:ABC-type multidrug transport system ATPase subunit